MSDKVTPSVGEEASFPVSNVELISSSVSQIEKLTNQTIQEVVTIINSIIEFNQHITDNIKNFISVSNEENKHFEFEAFTRYNNDYMINIIEISREILNNLKITKIDKIHMVATQIIQQVTTLIKGIKEFQQHMIDHKNNFKSVDDENYEDEYTKFQAFTNYNYEYINVMIYIYEKILYNIIIIREIKKYPWRY
jgi:hypothetical protein